MTDRTAGAVLIQRIEGPVFFVGDFRGMVSVDFVVSVSPVPRSPSMLTLSTDSANCFHLRPKWLRKDGAVSPIDGKVSFTAADPNLCRVVPDDDGLGAYLLPGTLFGPTSVTVSADVDPGPGVVNVSDVVNIAFAPALADHVDLGSPVAEAIPANLLPATPGPAPST